MPLTLGRDRDLADVVDKNGAAGRARRRPPAVLAVPGKFVERSARGRLSRVDGYLGIDVEVPKVEAAGTVNAAKDSRVDRVPADVVDVIGALLKRAYGRDDRRRLALSDEARRL